MPDAITFQHYEVLVRDDGAPWELGRGAMGVTYKALDTNLRVPVALKVIHPRQLDSELVAQRFVREARAAARLRHPHIAAVYHLGQEGENWFYAMEFVAGDTAEGLVKREGPLSESIVVQLAIQAARALNAAAALGLVHRDIKPSNLMLSREGDEWQLKLIDFGLARTFAGGESDEDLAAVTHSGFVGTPYYASPEQLEQKELDIRSDIYSLGVTMWYMLTGKVPFTGSVVSVLSQHLHKAPPFEQLANCTSPTVRNLIERMLAKDPAARPQTALDLRRELEQCNCAPAPASITAAPPVPVSPPPEPPPSEEAIETLIAAPQTEAPPASAPNESQFEGAETVAEFGFGQLCRTRERTSGALFAMLRLRPLRGLEESAAAELRQTIDRARTLEHPQVWRVHDLEESADSTRIVMDWSDGYTWRDLLRRHRELAPAEAFRLLAAAAAGIDAILGVGIEQPDVSLAGLWCESPTPDALPTGVKVSPLGLLRTLSLDSTWLGEGTIAGPGATGPESGARGAIRGLAQVAYETLGGAVTAPGFPPLPALSEAANKVLRTALRDPGQFRTASALIEQLTRAEAEPERDAKPRAAAASPTPTVAPPPPEPEPSPEEPAATAQLSPMEQPPAPPIAESADPATSDSVDGAESVPAQEVEEPEPVREWRSPEPPTRSSALPIAVGVAVIAGIAWFILNKERTPEPKPLATEPIAKTLVTTPPTLATPPPAPAPSTPTPKPVATVPVATPAPVPPPPPPPTREELAHKMQQQASDLRERLKWKESAKVLLAMRESYPEFAAADVELELLFRDLRWRYTPYREQPPDLKREDVEALRPELEKADQAGIIGARMLLGEHLSTAQDWRKAIEYYEKARARAPKATTRAGLLYARFSKDPAELAKAWDYLQAAHQAGDLDGKVAVAECLLHGDFGEGGGSKVVPGLKADEQRGTDLLREVISVSPRRQTPAELANADLAETYVTEPNRSKLVLGGFYLEQEQTPNRQPAWYRAQKETINHARELRRLLEEAKEDWSDAFALLGVAHAAGIGGEPNRATAKTYFEQGVARGNTLAMMTYAQFLTGPNFKNIPAEARSLFARAAEKGHPGAMDFCLRNSIPFKKKVTP